MTAANPDVIAEALVTLRRGARTARARLAQAADFHARETLRPRAKKPGKTAPVNRAVLALPRIPLASVAVAISL